ncbi:MAG: FeoB-associated Cys-rich membrane protein [Oscillospiraceae bacterium]
MGAYIGTVAVALILVVIVGAVIYKMVSDKRKGKSSCGCNCGCCPNSSLCHRQQNE